MTLASDPSPDRQPGDTEAQKANQDAQASEKPEASASQAEQGAKPTEPAKSPSADEKDAKAERKSLLETVKAVLPKKDAAPGASSAPDAKPDADKAPDGKAEAKADAKPEGDDARFDKHPRWQELLRERDTFKKDAEQYQKIQSFVIESGLSNDEVATGYKIMAAMKNDPASALEMLEPYVTELRKIVGDILPEDIARRVEDGALDEASARELARTRSAKALAEDRAKRDTESRQRDDLARLEASRLSAVNQWGAEVKARDPSFDKKVASVMDRAKVIVADLERQGIPASSLTPQEAVQIAQKAYEDVNERYREFAPRKPEIKPVPSGNSSTSATPVIRSTQDAVRAALQRAG